jgi:leucyl/phenylalanyl-tRNA--protein transferase
MIGWLEHDAPFPPVAAALRHPNGLLAAGADLTPRRILDAYRQGIFPWFNPGEPILWWSPDPRMVLFPHDLRISRSLSRRLRRGEFELRCDSAFAAVIRACAQPRPEQHGTWITSAMQRAYLRLHELGHAHCVECWCDGVLAGGLYGIAIGRAFYGESMFSHRTDASKAALAHLARYLESRGYAVIDCQMSTTHLASLGAREIRRSEFVAALAEWTQHGDPPGKWPANAVSEMFAVAS